MAKDLVVGSAGLKDVEKSVANFLASKNLNAEVEIWLGRPNTIAEISCLNGATVMEFLRHAVQLEGYEDENVGFAAGCNGKLNGKNLPWWDNSMWLPLDFNDPGGLDDDPTFFIGSCQRLVAELDEMKRTSPLRLGEVVSEYSGMRADFLRFMRSDMRLDLSAEDCVCWIWRALRDGAELAMVQNAVLWAGPD